MGQQPDQSLDWGNRVRQQNLLEALSQTHLALSASFNMHFTPKRLPAVVAQLLRAHIFQGVCCQWDLKLSICPQSPMMRLSTPPPPKKPRILLTPRLLSLRPKKRLKKKRKKRRQKNKI